MRGTQPNEIGGRHDNEDTHDNRSEADDEGIGERLLEDGSLEDVHIRIPRQRVAADAQRKLERRDQRRAVPQGGPEADPVGLDRVLVRRLALSPRRFGMAADDEAVSTDACRPPSSVPAVVRATQPPAAG